MLKAVKNYHYNKKKKTLQHQGIRHLEEYVFDDVSLPHLHIYIQCPESHFTETLLTFLVNYII